MANATERRCSAKNRRGERCAVHVVNAAGYCVAHDPEKPADMRALGKRSAEARRKPNPERVHESLREYLKREVPPERVWHALEAAMSGNSESARVSASRVLMDALAEPTLDRDEQRRADRQRAAAEAKARLSALLEAGASIEDAAATLDAEAVSDHPDLIVVGDVSDEECERILMDLAGMGMFDERFDERVEVLAQDRLKVLKAEHGISA